MAFTFLNSIGSAIVYQGMFFLAKHQYGFSTTANFGLALLYGLAYIPAALFVGPILRGLAARFGITQKHALQFTMASMALLCWLPWLVSRFESPSAPSDRASWPIWLVLGLYSPLSGAMWPSIESFLAGGRSEAELRSAIGKFNISWSSALALTLMVMSPLIDRHALAVMQALGIVHALCLFVLLGFPSVPGSHEHRAHVAPDHYRRLLATLRLLLPTSFMFLSTLSPYLPAALERLHIRPALETLVAATWYSTRVLTFAAMERWHGWHGRWSTPIFGGIVLLASFGLVILAPIIGGNAFGLPLLLLGLASFGVGVGVIYATALYYAMEVGASGVDAGGIHETVIGIGYTTGPLCGLAATGAVSAGLIERRWFSQEQAATDIVMVGMVSVLALTIALIAVARALSHRTTGGEQPTVSDFPRTRG